MTAITRSKAPIESSTTAQSPRRADQDNQQENEKEGPDDVESFPPSSSEEEARTRFVSALTDGVDVLMRHHGHGRDRACADLLREIADGCSPDENEVSHQVFNCCGSCRDNEPPHWLSRRLSWEGRRSRRARPALPRLQNNTSFVT